MALPQSWTVFQSFFVFGDNIFEELSEEAIQIAEERREAIDRGERERYTQLKAEFQRTPKRDKKPFINEQCKEVQFSSF